MAWAVLVLLVAALMVYGFRRVTELTPDLWTVVPDALARVWTGLFVHYEWHESPLLETHRRFFLPGYPLLFFLPSGLYLAGRGRSGLVWQGALVAVHLVAALILLRAA